MACDDGVLASGRAADEGGSLLSHLEKFLFDWDDIVGKVAFGAESDGVEKNWRKVAFGHAPGQALTVEKAKALARKLSDASAKLNPYEVFLLSFWTLVNTIEQRYVALLKEKETRFYRDAMRFHTIPAISEDAIRTSTPQIDADEDARAFRLRTRQRFLNATDLRKGFAYAFPENRIRIKEREREGDPRGGSESTMWILRNAPDAHGEYLLSERERENVEEFLRETTSVHTNTQTVFEANWTDCNVRFDWREGADEGRGERDIRQAFSEWVWTLWRFEPWAEAELRDAVLGFMSNRQEIRNVRVTLGANAVHNGLLKLTQFSELAKGE